MTKRLLSAVALLVLCAMALHGAAHAAALDSDNCAACAVGAARVAAPATPAVVKVELPAVVVAVAAAPIERAAVVPVPFARPPPRG